MLPLGRYLRLRLAAWYTFWARTPRTSAKGGRARAMILADHRSARTGRIQSIC